MSDTVDTRKLWVDVVDNMYDVLGLLSSTVPANKAEATEWLIEHVEEPVRALICELKGHQVTDDQCGIPEHRYCLVCGVRQPNAEINA